MFRLAPALICAFGIGLLSTGCGRESPQPKAEKSAAPAASSVTVKIGSASPLTGAQAHIGVDIRNGAQLAIDDLNAAGIVIGGKKVKFELLAEDDEANPTKATTVAQKLVDARVAGVVGHFNSGASIPASKVYADAGIPQISPSSTNPDYTLKGFRTTFRVVAHDELVVGVDRDDFVGALLGVRADYHIGPKLFIGAYGGYANLPGRDARAHSLLSYAQLEHRIQLGDRLGVPSRIALGYLARNGGMMRLSSGVAVRLGGTLELVFDVLAPSFWVTPDTTLFSLNFGLELGTRL